VDVRLFSKLPRSMRPSLGLIASALFALSAGLVAVAAIAQTPPGPTPPASTQTASPIAASMPATYVGSETCARCHAAKTHSFDATLMGQVFLHKPRTPRESQGCETCHGPGSAHAARPRKDDGAAASIIAFRADSPRPVSARNAVCLSCHETGERTHWRGSQHEARNVACTDCHTIMEKVSQTAQLKQPTENQVCTTCHNDRRAQLWRTSHMPLREGGMQCSSCHQPHGTANQTLLRQATVNDTCYTCHADKRGPFLFEHAPVRENCATCHDPHGATNEALLKVARPRLCQECHSESTHPAMPQTPTSLYAFNRSCQNCHVQVHGSNDPSGARLHR
jgi:DmsE family decaheme c-type cytochrome